MGGLTRRPPPRHERELLVRAEALAGRTVGELALGLGAALEERPDVRTKGLAGDLLERALGASAGSAAEPDFPSLGIELKTIPIDRGGRVVESTFVCTIALARIADQPWRESWVRRKLSQVLWVPIESSSAPLPERRLGRAVLWRPSEEEERELAADYEAVATLVGLGGTADLDARLGRHLQVRPKGPDGRARTTVIGDEGDLVEAVPRGFYLRPSFTSALLARAYAAAVRAVDRRG